MMAVYNSNGLDTIRHMDYLGSSRLASTWGQSVTSKESYAPFGEAYNESGSPDRSFTGQDEDPNSPGMYDFMFRRYDAAAGRWLSPDPAGWGAADPTNPQSFDRYAYVMNNPMSFVDPLGLKTLNFLIMVNGCLYQVTQIIEQAPNSDHDGTHDKVTSTTYQLEGCSSGPSGSPSYYVAPGGAGGAPNNGPTVSHCLGVAAKAKGLSIGLDILGAIPVFGNGVSAGAGIVRAGIAVDHVITSPAFALASGAYGGYGAVTAGPGEATDSLVGAGSAATGIGLTLADVSLEGTKAIQIVGNVASGLTGLWDGYQAYKKYQSCMAGH